jgi:hypothetical protein
MKSLIILDVTSAIEQLLVIILLLNILSLFCTLFAYNLSKRIKDKLLIRWIVLIIASLAPVFISHALFSKPAEIVPFTIFTATIGSLVLITYLIFSSLFRLLRRKHMEYFEGKNDAK